VAARAQARQRRACALAVALAHVTGAARLRTADSLPANGLSKLSRYTPQGQTPLTSMQRRLRLGCLTQLGGSTLVVPVTLGLAFTVWANGAPGRRAPTRYVGVCRRLALHAQPKRAVLRH